MQINHVNHQILMRPRRLERLTYGLGNRRSIHLSYGRIEHFKNFTNIENASAKHHRV